MDGSPKGEQMEDANQCRSRSVAMAANCDSAACLARDATFAAPFLLFNEPPWKIFA